MAYAGSFVTGVALAAGCLGGQWKRHREVGSDLRLPAASLRCDRLRSATNPAITNVACNLILVLAASTLLLLIRGRGAAEMF